MKLVAENLSIGYGSKVVFGNINFTAAHGDMVTLLGVNGIGKSTLLRTLSGLQKSLGGSLTIAGKNLYQVNAAERARLVSIVLTERLLIDNISVRNLVALGRAPYTNALGTLSAADVQQVEDVIATMHLQHMAHRTFNHLSDGERQKVLIARALCQQTDVIILDEPTAFLDFRNKREILKTLAGICHQLGKIVVLSTHDVETALEYSNKCWVMTEQKTFRQITASPHFKTEVQQVLYGNGE